MARVASGLVSGAVPGRVGINDVGAVGQNRGHAVSGWSVGHAQVGAEHVDDPLLSSGGRGPETGGLSHGPCGVSGVVALPQLCVVELSGLGEGSPAGGFGYRVGSGQDELPGGGEFIQGGGEVAG